VRVDLGAVFRIDRPRRVLPDGMDLQATVPGSLSLWSITTTGHWIGYVSFTIRKADAGAAVAQWVLPMHSARGTTSPAAGSAVARSAMVRNCVCRASCRWTCGYDANMGSARRCVPRMPRTGADLRPLILRSSRHQRFDRQRVVPLPGAGYPRQRLATPVREQVNHRGQAAARPA
jgi:hypothetical protein